MATNKGIRSGSRRKVSPYRTIHKFPQAKGKTVEFVELSVSSDDYAIVIHFQDKTALSFDVEACVSVLPEFTDWKTGNLRPLKRWRPVHSKTSRL